MVTDDDRPPFRSRDREGGPAAQERQLDLTVAALHLLGVYTEEELVEARERMRRVATDPIHGRIADRRVEGGSGP